LTMLSSPATNRALVVENGELTGLLSITDVARALEVRRRPLRAAVAR
jgi:CBS domain-containing protein